MKKIVIVINDLKGNGAERVMITLADELISQGHECNIICFKNVQELPSRHKLNIHVFPMSYWRWIPRNRRGKALAPLLDRFILKCTGSRPDLVLSNLLPVDRIMAESKLPNVYLLIHSTISREASDKNLAHSKAGLEKLAELYDKKPVVCVSRGVLADFKNLLPDHHNVRYIYNPVDVSYILQSASLPKPIKLENPYLVHVGKFNSAKRHDRLLRAYAQSQSELPLVMVGQGPLIQQTQLLVNELNLASKVIFAGFHSNPYPIIAGATAMIVSSDYEGLGMVILEAQVLNIPVISTDCPSGPGEILPENNLVAVNDENALADKIRKVADNPDFFNTPMADKFTAPVVAQQYLDLINE